MSSLSRLSLLVMVAGVSGCVAPSMPAPLVRPPAPASFGGPTDSAHRADTTSTATVNWRTFFEDSTLRALIETAVANNPEMLSTLQEVEMARNEVRAIRGRLAPQVRAGATLGMDKSARYTAEGAGNASTDITEGKEVPEPLGDIGLGFTASWEADIRGRIRSQKGAALTRYLGTVEGSRYVMTSLVAEIANTYYELTALDAKLVIVQQAIDLQRNALDVVRAQREAAAVSELAVQQFQALLLNSQSLEFELRQQIREAENRLNLMAGRYPQVVARSTSLGPSTLRSLDAGLPAQLIQNRPDIRAAEFQLQAARFDVKAARAEFFPELNLSAGLGLRAFSFKYLFTTPESMAWSVAGDAMAPLLNRTAIKAEFARASAAQQKALYDYRRVVLGGVTEVSTLVSAIDNLQRMYTFKAGQSEAMDRAIEISGDLFNAARANYLEVLTAQREALDVKLELVEMRLHQQEATTSLYRALGGGWR